MALFHNPAVSERTIQVQAQQDQARVHIAAHPAHWAAVQEPPIRNLPGQLAPAMRDAGNLAARTQVATVPVGPQTVVVVQPRWALVPQGVWELLAQQKALYIWGQKIAPTRALPEARTTCAAPGLLRTHGSLRMTDFQLESRLVEIPALELPNAPAMQAWHPHRVQFQIVHPNSASVQPVRTVHTVLWALAASWAQPVWILLVAWAARQSAAQKLAAPLKVHAEAIQNPWMLIRTGHLQPTAACAVACPGVVVERESQRTQAC
jgi:hypothetical protein